ncbi:hypothetical protein BU23DRAFT_583715 [Bimuria novae-zelandiae CBS 107.79]|uniref:Uncharacterized protein n=1 Tax=Bimuria novae-zelandiae CBS 107.79 TaxID=1447943 RepID=A0A6A5US26_9PLEO|nr:hypothetical protein BU23DRAFT_583715 [Bimuria novae-zelandiae CBS 107.79]
MVNGLTTFRNPNAPQQQHASPIDIIVLLAKNKRKANVYITKKKKANLKLAIKLRNNKVIIILSALFKEVYSRIYIFKSRLVQERVIIALAPMLRIILAHLPTKLAPRYLEGTLLHWTTYHRHHYKELDISTLTYDPCLLVINSNADNFGIVTTFLAHKEKMLKKAYYTLIIDASNIDNYKATLNLKQKG